MNFAVNEVLKIDSTKVLVGEVGVSNSSFEFFDCFCTKSDSGISIVHYNNYGLGGQTLILSYNQDQFASSLESWTDYGKPPVYRFNSHSLELDSRTYALGDTLMGSIKSEGYSISQNEEPKSIDFYVRGTFKCLIRDSTYDIESYENDLRERWNRQRVEEFITIANSDSTLQFKELDLNNMKIESIPIEVTDFSNIEKLELIGNNISLFNLEILKQLEKLTSLRLDYNDIQDLPNDLRSLKGLEILNLGSNPIKDIRGIYTISTLKELDLSLTEVTEISRQISKLKGLEKLNLRVNDQLMSIDRALFDLSNLKELHLPDHINSIDIGGSVLNQLESFSCSFDLLKKNEKHLSDFNKLNLLFVTLIYESSDQKKAQQNDDRQWLESYFPNARITYSTWTKPKRLTTNDKLNEQTGLSANISEEN